MTQHTKLLIIGAGPFGLAMAASAKHHNIDYMVLGKPMEFWKTNMPKGMLLRSDCEWHLDPVNIDTIHRYLETKNLTPNEVEPLSLEFYLGYTQWFQEQKQIQTIPYYVEHLDYSKEKNAAFEAKLENGQTITAQNVVIAPGFSHFKNLPEELVAILPQGRYAHTRDLVDFGPLKNKRCLIIGGRQSAFEWTALIHEQGAKEIHVCHRHPSPAFQQADWSWVDPLVDAMVEDPGWFRNLTQEEKDEVNHRLWAEGRLKVEPWLESRVLKDNVRIWANTQVINCDALESGELKIKLANGEILAIDEIILATGYKVNMRNIPFLRCGNVLEQLELKNGFPVLDESFQSNIPGLFITSMPATQDFGPFFGFTIAVRTSAKLITKALV